MTVRRDPEAHRDQVRRGAAARNAAVKRLIETHRKQYERFYEEEAHARGVEPKKIGRKPGVV